jgi:glycosyltransferase involved in cell wall biosynthesis
MRTQLVLITAGFPFGTSETFLENEITFLADGFEHVHIVCPDTRVNTQRTLPANCTVYRFNNQLTLSDKLNAFSGVFTSEFKNEMRVVRQKYSKKRSLGIVKTALISLFQAKRLVHFLNKKFLQQKDPEKWVFYSYWCDDAAVALALLSAQHTRLKTVTRAHGWDVYFQVHAVNYLPFRTLIGTQLHMICPISEKGKQNMRDVWKIDEKPIHVSRLGVLPGKLRNNSHEEIPTLVSCSNLIPLKRVMRIAETVLLFNKNIRWFHFGSGSEMNTILAFIQQHQKDNHEIHFFGQKTNEEVLEFYKNNDVTVFLNVSSSEGIPVSIMEAFSFGIPAIATDVGGTSEIVNNQNGILLSENPTPHEIKAAIEEVITHPEKREAAYQTWNELYNAEKNYVGFVKKLTEFSDPL